MKVLGWITVSILALLILVLVLIRVPAVQQRITQRAVAYLKNKLGTEVRLGRALVAFPKQLVLEGLYVEDQSADTLIYAGKLEVNADLWALTRNTLDIKSITLTNFTGNIKRSRTDSTFNFSYIIEAFAGDTAAPADTTATPWAFNVQDISLEQLTVLFDDRLSGTTVRARIGELDLPMEIVNLAQSTYKAGDIRLENATISFEDRSLLKRAPDISASDSSVMPDVTFEEVDLKRVNVRYTQVATKKYFQAKIHEAYIDINEFDLPHQRADIDNIELKHSFITYNFFAPQETPVAQTQPAEPFTGLNIPWDIRVRDLSLEDNSLQYYNSAVPVQKGSVDFNHLWIFGLQAQVNNLAVRSNTAQADIESFSFQEKSNFALQTLQGNLKLEEKKLVVDNFLLESGGSHIEANGEATFKSLTAYETARVNLQIQPSTVATQDILFFAPHLLDSLPITLPARTQIAITSTVTGTVSDLTIQHLTLKTLASTSLSLQGNIRNITEPTRMRVNLQLRKFFTTARDLHTVLQDSLLPESIQVPDTLSLRGSMTGLLNAPAIRAQLTTSSGNALLSGKFDFRSVSTYAATVETKNLHLGKILKQPQTLGMLDMKASVKGKGLDVKTLNASADIHVSRFHYNNYAYTDFNLTGSMNRYLFSGEAFMHDENLDFTITGDLDYTETTPRYKLALNLVNADFQKLNLSERPLKARGGMKLNLATSNFQVINGDLSIYKVGIYNGEKLYLVDSLLFASIDQEGKSSMTIRSEILSGKFEGTFNVFTIGTVMKQHINRYFALHDKTVKEFTTPQNFTFELAIRDTDLITEILFPEFEPFVPGVLRGEFDSETHVLDVQLDLAKITYASTSFDSVAFRVQSDEEELTYRLRLKNVLLDTLTIDAVQLTGKVAHDSIYSAVQILNSKNENKYLLGGVFRSQENNFRFRFLNDQVMLNYSMWSVPNDNYLEFSPRGFVAHNFVISKDPESIGLVTTVKDSTLSVEFQRVQLSNLTRIVRGVMPASGMLNGNLKFTSSATGRFSSELKITDLEVLEKPFGDLTLGLAHAGDRYNIALALTNQGSNLHANGYYVSTPDQSGFNLTANFDPLNLQAIEPLSFGQLRNTEGRAVGQLKISGTFDRPQIRGNITFQDATFKSTYLNSNFSLRNESIAFQEQGIRLNNFTITDARKNEAVIDGNILTDAYRDFRFNLTLSTRNFQVLNTTAEDNKLYYGKVKLNAKARITGNSRLPRVDVTVGFSDDTNLTYVVPQAQKSVMEQKGIVEFIDKDAYKDPFLATLNISDTVRNTFSGVNISANLELTDKETLNIVIDPVTGDKLTVKGNSTLTFDMSASGNMSLSGRYEISEGTYNFSFYKLVKREFKIVKGGSLTWSGDPLNAQIDIRASHLVETSPIDLVANQINDANTLNSYRQRLPFYVYLDIKGQLLAPMISFKLDMPVDKQSAMNGVVYAKILDINSRESDVNKQVFALLILRRFISENPLESQGGSDIANTTRTSVSRLLSDQLNRLSENVKGVQLSLDIKSYEDYSTGQAQGNTQVQLGVSKSLLNDRLVVKLSGNVSVEGENTAQRDASDYIGDLALEYKLTSDGRFRITGFRTSNYDMIDGELTETGVGLIYVKDYNTLKELFKSNAAPK